MDKKYIKRLKLNINAAEEAFNRLEVASENLDKSKVYASVGEVLMWVTNIDDWHKFHRPKEYKHIKKKDDGGSLLFGFRFAYNSIKHNMEVIQLPEVTGGFTSPFTLPFRIDPIKITWINNKEIDITNDEKKKVSIKKQRQNYIKYIEGKSVLDTFKRCFEFLERENKKIR